MPARSGLYFVNLAINGATTASKYASIHAFILSANLCGLMLDMVRWILGVNSNVYFLFYWAVL